MKIILTASTLAVALVGTVTAQCDPNDWADDAATNHFTADCSGAVNTDDPCLVTMAADYMDGEVKCVDQGTHFEYEINEATFCGVALPGAATCTYDGNVIEVSSCAAMRNTQCYPRCEKKIVSGYTGPIGTGGGTYGCAPLCNASDADFGWVNDETTNHFVVDCSNATEQGDKCAMTVSDGYFYAAGGVSCGQGAPNGEMQFYINGPVNPCSDAISSGAATCTYDSDSGNVEPTSCAPVKDTECYPSCERKVVSEWDGPINDNGGTYGCAPLCNASDAEFGWVNNETAHHFFADCSNATEQGDKCAMTVSDGYFYAAGGVSCGQGAPNGEMQFRINGPANPCSGEDPLYATCTYDSDTDTVNATSCVPGFVVNGQGTCVPVCSPTDWTNNATTHHFTANCTAALKGGEQCAVTAATGYFGGEVTCVDQGTHFEHEVQTEASLCSGAVAGATTCTYDPNTDAVEPTSCVPMHGTECYPRCEKKNVSEWVHGPIIDDGGNYGCAPLCNANDAEFGWVNNETANHFFADCSNATEQGDKCAMTVSDGYFYAAGGVSCGQGTPNGEMQFHINGPVIPCSDADPLYATCTYDSDTDTVNATFCVPGFAVEQGTCVSICHDWDDDEPVDHFLADCTGATSVGDTCVVTASTGFYGGSVTCAESLGWYFHRNTSKPLLEYGVVVAQACGPNVLTCSDGTTALTCDAGYTVEAGACIEVNNECNDDGKAATKVCQCEGTATCKVGEFCWEGQCQQEMNPCAKDKKMYCGVLQQQDSGAFEKDFEGSCHACDAEPTTCAEFLTFVAPEGCYHSCALGLTEKALVEWATEKFKGVECDEEDLTVMQADLAADGRGSLSGAGMLYIHEFAVVVVAIVVGAVASTPMFL